MYIKFSLTALLISLVTSCMTTAVEPLDITCDRLLKESIKLYQQHKASNGKDLEQIANLLRSGKIQQQHAQFAECTQSAGRAKTLLLQLEK